MGNVFNGNRPMAGRLRTHNENTLQVQICRYIKLRYPGVIFNSDQAGVNNVSRYSRGVATQLRSDRGYPDLFIAEPRGKYHGMYLELKTENARVYLKSGILSTEKHIQEQAVVLQKLTSKGYYANFAQGYDDAIKQIDDYLGTKKETGPTF